MILKVKAKSLIPYDLIQFTSYEMALLDTRMTWGIVNSAAEVIHTNCGDVYREEESICTIDRINPNEELYKYKEWKISHRLIMEEKYFRYIKRFKKGGKIDYRDNIVPYARKYVRKLSTVPFD